MSYSNKIHRQLNELKMNNKELILEGLTILQLEELEECAYRIHKLENNKYLILEN